MICAILINYFSSDRTIQYLEDYTKSVCEETSFIIIDNSCDTTEHQKLSKKICTWVGYGMTYAVTLHTGEVVQKYDGKCCILLVKNTRNSGFAQGNNLGAHIAKEIFDSKYLLFTNNDILFPQQVDMELLIYHLNSDMNIAVVGPKIVGLNAKPQSPAQKVDIWHRWVYPLIFWPLGNYFSCIRRIVEKSGDTIQNAVPGKVYRVMGSFMLCRTDRFFECGLFDENTFLYGEEMILSERLKSYGYSVYYDNRVEIIHEGGYTTKEKKKGIDLTETKRRFASELYYYQTYIGSKKILCNFIKILFKFYIVKVYIMQILSEFRHKV